MSMANKKKRVLSVQKMAELVLKDLVDPKDGRKNDPRSKQLQDLLKQVPQLPLKKLEDWKNEVFDLGRKEGFDDMLIGKWVRKAMDEADYSDRTIRRLLPDTAKQLQEHVKNRESVTNDAKADKMSALSPAIENDSESVREQVPKVAEHGLEPLAEEEEEEEEEKAEAEQERPEIWQISLSDARPEDVDRYDVPALRRLLKEALVRIYDLEEQARRKSPT